MKRLVTMMLSLMLGTSIFADNELLVGDINLSATVDQIGGASITIPIEVPVGINGMQPNLALVYNSHSGYGLAGWGWDLAGISSIQRTGKTIYHDGVTEGIKRDRTDNLLFDGERLLLSSGSNLYYNSVYHTERESFNQVICLGSGYSVQFKDGRVALYGTEVGSQYETLFTYITRMTDPNGNYMTYDYKLENHEITIQNINYTYNEGLQAAYIVEFQYIESPYLRQHYIGESMLGSLKWYSKLLSKIHIKCKGRVLYSYCLTYDTSDIQPRLTSVEKVADNGDRYPATVITWNSVNGKPEATTTLSQACKEKIVFGDFNQDGKTDFISYSPSNPTLQIYTNTTNDNGVLSFQCSSFNSGKSFYDLRAADYNGDGRTDLVGRYVVNKQSRVTYLVASGTSFATYSDYISLDGSNFLLGDFDGDGADEIFNPYTNRMYSYGEGYITLSEITVWDDANGGRIHSMGDYCIPLDFNGNGKTDIILSTTSHYYIFEYDSTSSSFQMLYYSSLSQINSTPTFSNIKFGDFNGDGKTDILSLAYDANYTLMATIYNNGTIESYAEEVYSPSIYVGDFNQDGMDDIAYVVTNSSDNKVYVRVGRSNSQAFVYDDQVLSSYTSDSQIDREKLFFRDLDGNGSPEFVYFANTSSIVSKQLSAGHPLFVTQVKDGMGNAYDFTYKPITNSNVYSNNRIGDNYVNPLVQPFHVVSDYTAPYTSLSYSYRNGRYHTQGKGLLGFEVMDITDNLNHTLTRNVSYYTADHFQPYPYSTTVMSLDGDTVTYTRHHYTVRTIEGLRIFPHNSGYEYTDYLTGLKETYVSIYDDNGNLDNETKTRGNWQEYTKYYYMNVGSWCPNRLDNSYTYNTYNGETSPYRRVHCRYDSRGNMTRQVVDTLDNNYRLVSQYAYDTFGNVTRKIVSGSGQTRICSYTYSDDGRFLLTATDELGQTTANTYDTDWGTLLTQTTNAGVTTNSYDTFGRLKQTEYPDGVIYTISSQFVSNVPGVRYMAHETRTNTPPITTYCNASGKPLFTKKMGHNDRQIYTVCTYYPNGQTQCVSEPFFSNSLTAASSQTLTSDNATIYTYDDYNRPYRVESPEGVTLYTYNGLNTTVNTPTINKSAKLNSSGFTEYEQVGATLIPLAERPGLTPLFKRVSYTYYPTGQVKSATPDGGTAVTMEYDIQGNRTKLIDPDAGTITNTYNAFGQVLSRSQNIHNSTPVVTTYNYESTSGRLLTETTVGDTTMTQTYTYDNTFKTSPSYVRFNDKECITYNYNEYGRPYKIDWRHTSLTPILRKTDTYQNGLLIKRDYPYVGAAFYTYDAYGNMIEESFGNTGNTDVVWQLLEQNARGQIVKEQKGDVITTYTYDKCGRVLSIVAPGIIDLAYVYDDRGNVVSKTDNICNQTIDYTYDHLMRLQSWTINDSVTHTVIYDAATGNIISKSDLGEQSAFSYDTSSKPHALLGVSGITSNWGKNDMDIAYTDFGKVKSIQSNGIDYQISYTPDGQRFKSVLSEDGHTTTRYYMLDSEIVVDSLGNEKRYHYLCHGDFGYRKGSAGRIIRQGYYDARGSLIVLRTTSGSTTVRYAYDPWGASVDPNDWTKSITAPEYIYMRRGYTMHERLKEFDLINMNGRVYDPAVAQFLSPDPYIQDAGNWLNYNRYAYCYNNPTRYTDPSGEVITEALVFAGIMALFQGSVNLGMQMYKGNVNSFWDGAAAFGIGAVSGAVSSLGGQLTFGLGGFWGGFVAGAQSGLYSSFLQGLGNYRLLGDEKLDGWDVAVSTISGGLTVGLVNGFVSYYGNGLSFWSGKAVYPENNGFQEGIVPQKVTLEKGQLIDRYGATSQFSDFVGDPNATIPQRSLSPYTNTSEYTLYQVTGDVNALKGPIAPAFKQPGGGIQYKLEVPISYLIKEGKLIIIYHSK